MDLRSLVFLLALCMHLKISVCLSGSYICPYKTSYEQRYETCRSSFWSGRSCSTRYRTVYYTAYQCCAGYGAIDDGCYSLCAEKMNHYGCNRNQEGYIVHRDGTITTNSGGTCSAPDDCQGCNIGYYGSTDGYCRACRTITYCHELECTYDGNSVCTYCYGEVKTTYGWYAYTRFTNGGLSCKQACSWRLGTRCYPGNCTDTTLVSCICEDGFSGVDCATIEDKPDLLQKMLRFSHHTEVIEVPRSGLEYTFTNLLDFSEASARIEGNFQRTLPSPPAYIKPEDTKLGIVYGSMHIKLQRENQSFPKLWHNCSSYFNPIPSNFQCESSMNISTWGLPFQHNDTVTFNTELRNGGFVTYYDRENNNTVQSYNFIGTTRQDTYFLVFDFKRPAHCLNEGCSIPPMDIPDTEILVALIFIHPLTRLL